MKNNNTIYINIPEILPNKTINPPNTNTSEINNIPLVSDTPIITIDTSLLDNNTNTSGVNNDDNLDDILDNNDNLIPFNSLSNSEFINKSQECCLVKKLYLPDKKNLYGGNFKYNFTKLSGDECNIELHNVNSNTQLFYDGENGWNNNYCINNSNKLGSCRNNINECIDFFDEDECKKYNMKWSENTCFDK